MPSPEEHGYELGPSRMPAADGGGPGIDPPRSPDRPARGSAENLEQRQLRLPHGHPSSNFDDDGNPKPALVPLRNLELPEAGDEREHNGIARGQAGRSGQAGRGDQGGQADQGGRADGGAWDGHGQAGSRPRTDPAGAGAAAVAELAVTKPDVWAAAAREPGTSESVPPERPAWAPARGERDGDGGTADSDAADSGTAESGTADSDEADAGPAVSDHAPITDDPAPAPAGPPEAKRAETLTPEQVRIAVRAHGRCRLAEGRSVFGTYDESGLTPAMRRIEEELDHGQLVPDTEKYALKSLDRFQEKLAKQIARFPGANATDLANEIHDGVRYTFVFDADNYVDGITNTRAKIEAEGYSLIEMKPSWHADEYKGVNSRWRDVASGSLFEVQWHTPASWEAKQRTHDAYEKIERTDTPLEEVERLRAYQRAVCAAVPVPPGALEMRGYKKES